MNYTGEKGYSVIIEKQNNEDPVHFDEFLETVASIETSVYSLKNKYEFDEVVRVHESDKKIHSEPKAIEDAIKIVS